MELHYNKKVFLYVMWFHWILNEFTSYNEKNLVQMQWIYCFSEQELMNYTHILILKMLKKISKISCQNKTLGNLIAIRS